MLRSGVVLRVVRVFAKRLNLACFRPPSGELSVAVAYPGKEALKKKL